ncbi:hypothetical protein [Asticcacaulis sp.]|uniref:hypothetical protein n=1 Tax=Asticcacaulis sp. TaxID=1872648 RepID=UPI0026291DA3|nr:hypothetical protein [Asticcacaulis sp.]
MTMRNLRAVGLACLLTVSGLHGAVAAEASASQRSVEIARELSELKSALAEDTQALKAAKDAGDQAAGCRTIRTMRPKIQRMYDLLVELKTADPAALSAAGGEALLEKMQQGMAMTDKGLAEKCEAIGS